MMLTDSVLNDMSQHKKNAFDYVNKVEKLDFFTGGDGEQTPLYFPGTGHPNVPDFDIE